MQTHSELTSEKRKSSLQEEKQKNYLQIVQQNSIMLACSVWCSLRKINFGGQEATRRRHFLFCAHVVGVADCLAAAWHVSLMCCSMLAP